MSPKVDRVRLRARKLEKPMRSLQERKEARRKAAKNRPAPRIGTPLKLDTSWQRIVINALLLVIAVFGAGLQLLEFRHGVPGQQRLLLAAYISVGVFAATTLVMRIRKRMAERAST